MHAMVLTAPGAGVTSLAIGERVGVPWLGHTCGECSYCPTGDGKHLGIFGFGAAGP